MKILTRTEVLIGIALIVLAACNTVHLNKIMSGFGFALLYLPAARYVVNTIISLTKRSQNL